MEIKAKSLPPCAWCKAANKDIEDLNRCPICNFDDDGDYCVPSLCDYYTENLEE